jgi:hypothetical protein
MSEEQNPFWRPGHRWEDNIKINLKEMECDNVEEIHLAHYRIQWRALMNTEMNLQVH